MIRPYVASVLSVNPSGNVNVYPMYDAVFVLSATVVGSVGVDGSVGVVGSVLSELTINVFPITTTPIITTTARIMIRINVLFFPFA